MKIFSAILSGVAVSALATSAGMIIPADTLALAGGVLIGAMAAIPVSVLLSAVLPDSPPAPLPGDGTSGRATVSPRPPYPRLDDYAPVRDYPPVVIINPSTGQSSRRPTWSVPAPPDFPILEAQRQFHVIGEAAQS